MIDKHRVCVILPCAGKGTRLGLPYPKELHTVESGKPLIDYSLEMVSKYLPNSVVCVVVNREKMLIISYLLERWPRLNFRFISQCGEGFLSAIFSCKYHLECRNIILLPDQYVNCEKSTLENAISLSKESPLALLACRRKSNESLENEGALSTKDNRLLRITEKPGKIDESLYDSAWCAISFTSSVFPSLMRSMRDLYNNGTIRNELWIDSPFNSAPVYFVRDYWDLGDWRRILEFKNSVL